MTQALNLANFANKVNTDGTVDPSAINGAVAEATQLVTLNFSCKQVGSKLYFYYGTTQIASLDGSGNFTSLANVTAYGTP